jgi:hypothetical protein
LTPGANQVHIAIVARVLIRPLGRNPWSGRFRSGGTTSTRETAPPADAPIYVRRVRKAVVLPETSCWMCANERRGNRLQDKTMQEVRFLSRRDLDEQ